MNKKINLAISFLAAFILVASATAPYFASSAHAQDIQGLLDTVIQAPHISEVNRARDQYRHPKETLLFFGLQPEMTVVEISPANGWCTEIIGSLLKKKGHFYAAVPSITEDMPRAMKDRDVAYRQMLKGASEHYGEPMNRSR